MRRAVPLALILPLLLASPLCAKEKEKEAKPAPAATAPAPALAPAADPSAGEMIDQQQQYKHCLALARTKPEDGWEEALAWSSLGGGEPARHCAALSLIALRQFEEGATRLEVLARDSHSSARIRAGMLAQAGQAWLLSGKPEKAYAAQTSALGLVPGAPDLLVDRAQTLADAKNYKEALTDLDEAVKNDPKRVDALVFRAATKRYLDDLKGASEDLAKALSIDGLYQDGWLESGMVKRLQGDGAGARKDWLKVLEIAPNSNAADAARRNIEMLDVEKIQN